MCTYERTNVKFADVQKREKPKGAANGFRVVKNKELCFAWQNFFLTYFISHAKLIPHTD